MNISQASRPIAIQFYLKHHWVGGKAAWGFGADQFRTLVSMATDSSHRVIMENKQRHHVFSNVFDRIIFILAGNDNMYESLDDFEIWRDSTTDYGVNCPWAYEKYPIDLKWVKRCHHIFSAIFIWILFIFAGNEGMHKSLDEFEIRSDATTGFDGNR